MVAFWELRAIEAFSKTIDILYLKRHRRALGMLTLTPNNIHPDANYKIGRWAIFLLDPEPTVSSGRTDIQGPAGAWSGEDPLYRAPLAGVWRGVSRRSLRLITAICWAVSFVVMFICLAFLSVSSLLALGLFSDCGGFVLAF